MSEDTMEICSAWWETTPSNMIESIHDCELPNGHDGDHLCECGIRCAAGEESGGKQ